MLVQMHTGMVVLPRGPAASDHDFDGEGVIVDWKEILKVVAPVAASLIGTPLAGVALKLIGPAIGLGDAPTPEAVQQAITNGVLTGEQMLALRQVDQQLTLKLEELGVRREELSASAVTDRWKADMTSDSSLSKNIRPLVLIYLLTLYALFAVLSAFNVKVEESYVVLLGNWGMLVMSAYFLGRTTEKAMAIYSSRS